MSNRNMRYLGMLALLVAAGCADERPPRSFVQPNIIKVADLTGLTGDPVQDANKPTAIWHYIQTVVGAPTTNGTAFQGQSSSLMKIKFEVQEEWLYARRAFEHVAGAEDGYWKDPAHYEGQVLAAWRISSHFDIIREYNSTTGEQTNKIIESTERPWQQREFIRVDWSQNAVTDYVGIGLDFFFSEGNPTVQPISYWISDPTHPDALHIERAPADDEQEGFKQGEANYLDITNMVQLTPDLLTATYQENGEWHSFTYPKCFMYYTQDDCATQQVKVRHAFAKIGNAHTYEPRNWDGLQMNLFGVWDVGLRRLVYDRNYGVVNSDFKRHAARFNIWKKSCSAPSAPPAGSPPGTVGPMTCNTDVDPAKATKDATGAVNWIPYEQREIRTIPYYAEGSAPTLLPDGTTDLRYPEDLFPEFKNLIGQWNDAMKGAVTALVNKAPDVDIFVACHNPVKMMDDDASPADPPACSAGVLPQLAADGTPKKDAMGMPIYRVRQGDPRRSMVFWVNEQQNAGPLGYGPPLFDEETGETISGQAYIYGAAVDTYTVRSRDIMLLQNGELATEDYTTGANVQEYVAKLNQTWRTDRQTFDPKQVSAMANAMDFDWAKGFTPDNGYPPIDNSSNSALKTSLGLREDAIWKGYFAQRAAADGRDNRLSRIVSKPLEKMMITQDNLSAGGVSPLRGWDSLNTAEAAQVSPIRSRIMEETSEKERLKAERLGVDFATFDDAGLSQRLRIYLNDPAYCPQGPLNCLLAPNAEKLRQSLRKEIFLGVTLHEVGHNMGCRHNFRASYDAMNYFPDYWKIRTEAVNHPDSGMKPNVDGQLHPRWVNVPGGATTQYELDNAVREKQYSSIMDYGAEFNSDLLGLGMYDKAVIKFSYAEMVEVFTDVNDDPASNAILKIGNLHAFQTALGFPSPLGPNDPKTGALTSINYTDYPNLFKGGWQGIYKRANVKRTDVTKMTLDMNGDTVMADTNGRPIVPYYFCSDEFAGNLTCQRFDAGPDPYEQATDIISRYQNFYISNNFKRDRQSFHSSLGYKSRIAGRYFGMLRQQLTWYVLLRADFEGFTKVNCDLQNAKTCLSTNGFFTDEKGWGGFTLGVAQGFETIGQTLATPTMGLFGQHTDTTGRSYWQQFRDDLFTGQNLQSNLRRVDFIDGKYIDSVWDSVNCGYYWAEECQTRIGYMVDKQIALDVLTDSQANFTGRDTSTDVRKYAIGYIVPFKKQIEEKWGALLSGDYFGFAPVLQQKNAQEYALVQHSWVLDDPTAFPKLDRVDPEAGFTLQLYAGVYGLSSFPTTFDHEFLDNTQIFVVGNGEAPIPDSEVRAIGTSDPAQLVGNGGVKEWFVVTDPGSGKTYAAHSVKPTPADVLDSTGGTVGNDWITKSVNLRTDIAVRMLQRLQALAGGITTANALPANDPNKVSRVAAAVNDYDLYRQNVEVIRSLHNAFGYGQYKTDAPFYY